MKFEISTKTKDGLHVLNNAVAWIKAAREELGCGLKEAKDLRDHVAEKLRGYLDPYGPDMVTVDTDRITFLRYLELFVPASRTNNIARFPKPAIVHAPAPVNEADELLKRTAIRLIRMNEHGKAMNVLKLVI